MEKQRRDFLEIQDTNKDEKLDKQELMQLIFPANYSAADSEAKQLLMESDTNKVQIHFNLTFYSSNSLTNGHAEDFTSVSPSTVSL